MRVSGPDFSSSLRSASRLHSVHWEAASVMRWAGRTCLNAERRQPPSDKSPLLRYMTHMVEDVPRYLISGCLSAQI